VSASRTVWEAQPSSFTLSGRNDRSLVEISRHLEAAGVVRPRLLSFGCSEGLEPLDMRRLFPHGEVHGCDVNREALAIAAERCRDADILLYESGPEAILGNGPYHGILVMNVLVNWPASYGLEEIGDLYTFELFDRTVTTLVDALAPGGILAVYNACYCVEHTSAAPRLKPVAQPLPKDNGWVDKFDPSGRRVAIACDAKDVPITTKNWRRYMYNNAEMKPHTVRFAKLGPADCRTILWRRIR